MAKWKLFKKSKKVSSQDEIQKDEVEESSKNSGELKNDNREDTSELDYRETLYSKGDEPQEKQELKKEYISMERTRHDVGYIEEDIDHLDKKKNEQRSTHRSQDSASINDLVDRVISKKRKEK